MIPVVVGWGKKGKELGYAGVEKCPHCKNWSPFHIYEMSNRVRLYWVPVAKFNTKRYFVCGTCETAWELDKDKAREMLAASAALPEPTTVTQAFNRCCRMVAAHADDISEFPEEGMALVKEELSKEYGARCADYVFPRAMGLLTDSDSPR